VLHGRNGYLVDSADEMARQVVRHFAQREGHAAMRREALLRVADYQAEPIMRRFLGDMGLPVAEPALERRSVA
jgi:hypothetical protein